MAAVSSAWFTTPRRGLTPRPGHSPRTRACGSPTLPAGRVVALTDFSASATNAAWRAALVARDLGLPLHIVGLCRAAADRRATQLLLDQLTGELRRTLQMAAPASVVQAGALDGVADAVRGAALLVVDAMHGSRWRNWLFGSLAQKLLRRCRTPVLAVRRPAIASYRRVTVSVDLASSASRVIAAARALSRDHRLQVLHVLPARDRARTLLAGVPLDAVRSQCEQAADAARHKLAGLIAQAGACHDAVVPVTVFGHVPTAVLEQERRSRAQLLVLGHAPRGALTDLVLGGVVRWLLPAPQADVLLVPLPPGSGTARADALPRARPS